MALYVLSLFSKIETVGRGRIEGKRWNLLSKNTAKKCSMAGGEKNENKTKLFLKNFALSLGLIGRSGGNRAAAKQGALRGAKG